MALQESIKVLCLLACFVTMVTGITNLEFYNAVKPFASEIEILSNASDDVEQQFCDVDDDVIILPGVADDELDVERLFTGVSDHGNRGVCHCEHHKCSCCVEKTFKAKIIFKKIKFHLKVCVDVEYLVVNKGFKIAFHVNNHQMYSKETSLVNPPRICVAIPGLGGVAKVCLQLHNIDLDQMRVCARVSGVIDVKIKQWSVNLNIACFNIPVPNKDLEPSHHLHDLDIAKFFKVHISAGQGHDQRDLVCMEAIDFPDLLKKC